MNQSHAVTFRIITNQSTHNFSYTRTDFTEEEETAIKLKNILPKECRLVTGELDFFKNVYSLGYDFTGQIDLYYTVTDRTSIITFKKNSIKSEDKKPRIHRVTYDFTDLDSWNVQYRRTQFDNESETASNLCGNTNKDGTGRIERIIQEAHDFGYELESSTPIVENNQRLIMIFKKVTECEDYKG